MVVAFQSAQPASLSLNIMALETNRVMLSALWAMCKVTMVCLLSQKALHRSLTVKVYGDLSGSLPFPGMVLVSQSSPLRFPHIALGPNS